MDRSTSYEHMYAEKIDLMTDEKQRIAERAVLLVHPGDTIIIDSGTTTFYIAQALSRLENLTLITNDLFIASQTPIHPSSTMIVTGGMRRQGRQELVGTLTENFLRDTHVDIAFIGAGPIGRLDIFEKDGNIPLKYDMDQCAGVIMYAQHAKI